MDVDPPTLPGFEHLAPVAVVPDDASPTVRRTARRRLLLEAGVHPATGLRLFPAVFGHQCGGCANAVKVQHGARSYWKCNESRLGLSHSAASDIRVTWPACELFKVPPPAPIEEDDPTHPLEPS
jgi:hypothetical protein